MLFRSYSTSDTCVAAIGSVDTADGSGNIATIVVQKRLTNSKASAIVFTQAPLGGLKDLSQESLKSAFTDADTTHHYVNLVKSIRSLP